MRVPPSLSVLTSPCSASGLVYNPYQTRIEDPKRASSGIVIVYIVDFASVNHRGSLNNDIDKFSVIVLDNIINILNGLNVCTLL